MLLNYTIRMLSKNYYLRILVFVTSLFTIPVAISQNAIWIEDFDDGGGTRWTLENAPGSLTSPTPLGIVGLTYGTNAVVAHDNFIINDQNTPELGSDIAVGLSSNAQGQLVQGRHYACAPPNNLPNPFINTPQPGPNQSLHITAYPTCATLLFGGVAQSNDWNCISDPDNGDIQTQTEQIAFLNNNIDATGSCNLIFTADFFLGGDSDGIKSHGTVLYSVDAGVTWQILEDNLRSCSPFLAGTCNNWFRRSFAIPADANNQNDLRIAFRWYDDGDINNTGDYALGASFNVDNVVISACAVPAVNFIVSQTTGCKGDAFYFTDQSTVGDGNFFNCSDIISGNCSISGYSWNISPTGANFIGGTSSSSQNPQVEFTANGTYTVELTATNCAGNGVLIQSLLIVITDCPPIANFITSQTAACAVPSSVQDTVTFTDLSTSTTFSPITAWNWVFTPATVTFVNGTNASMQNVDVVFDAIGTYQVALTVTNAEGNDTETKVAYIEALDCNCGGGGGGGPVTIFEEDFDGNGGAGSNWVTTPLNNDVGVQGITANQWYISDVEAGNAAGACGSAGGGDQSLHVSVHPSFGGDVGAAYANDVACLPGCFNCDFSSFCYDMTANKRSMSQNINSVGVTGLTLTFNYIENGQGAFDDCIFEYSIDGGANWLTLANPVKPSLGICAPQGLWTGYSIGLPVTCEGITNLRIAYRWQNNADGIGTDPSFAVDEILIIGTSSGGGAANTWEGDVSSVWNLAANWSTNAIPTSADDALVPATVCATCVMPQINAAAVARDVCNFGTITINGNNTLTIDRDLLNEGAIVTTTVNPAGDVVFVTGPSIYKGSGTLNDVDVSVSSSDLTLETDMSSRSMNIATTGTFSIATYRLSVNRNLSKSSGIFTAVGGTTQFIVACGTCLDQTNITDVSMNVNQVFGDVFVNKTTGIKASLVSAVNYTLNAPKTLTIQSGILDANTFTLNGTGKLTMNGGELQLAKCATILPEMTGNYTLPAGKITFDGVCAQIVKQTSVAGTNYFKVEFAGSGVKALSGNTIIDDSLIFSLPITLGNYVNAGLDTLFVTNNSTGIVSHTGGHVVGNYNRAFTPTGGLYTFHLGSDHTDLETYYEPLRFTPNILTGNSRVTARFLDLTPNPTTVVPGIIFGGPLSVDTVANVETEGYWHLGVENPVIGGNYTASVSPDIRYWAFTQVWGSDSYTLLKQDIEGDNWDYTINGVRVDDSTTMTFANFSNYALAYTNNGPLLSATLANYSIKCDDGDTYISWTTVSEHNSHSFIIQRSLEGYSFEQIAQIPSAVNSTSFLQYNYLDNNRATSSAYYRLLELDMDGEITVHGTIYVDCTADDDLQVLASPNPSEGAFNLTIFSSKNGLGTIEILDVTGKLVMVEKNIRIEKGFNHVHYSPELRMGVYLISVVVGSEREVIRMTIAK